MLELKNISFEVEGDKSRKEILKDVSLVLNNDEFVAVTGPNGGGKSTLAKIIAGIEKPSSGQILLDGVDITDLSITERAKAGISYAFQQPVRFKGVTVLDLIRLATGKNISVAGACEYLSEVGLCAKDYIRREVDGSLSGGELKRIEIATIIARATKLSVFDEPEAGIDLWSFNNLIKVFEKMHEEIKNSSTLIISHQERILNIADRIVVVAGGQISAVGTKDEILPELLEIQPEAVGTIRINRRYYMDSIQMNLLEQVAGLHEIPTGAYNIRANGESVGRNTTANIDIVTKKDVSGIDIIIKPGTKNESIHIPVLLSQSGLEEMVYNDFFIGEDCNITIIAGCGIHNGGDAASKHDGIHTFHIGKNARVKYVEKHYGSGDGNGKRIMNPQTIVYIDENGYMEMDTAQIKGVDSTDRYTKAELKAGAKLVVGEKLMTHGVQEAKSVFEVDLNGAGSGANIVSRSVAKDESYQLFVSRVNGNAPCSGHTECDAIIVGNAKISAVPEISANNPDAALIHEAAIGKIAGEQIIKLMTLGLTEQEAEEQIINGFLK